MTSRSAVLDHDLISRLRDAIPVPLVLHGSSGVADEDLARAVTCGITKINIGTILNVAFTNAVRDGLADTAVVDPRKYLSARPGRHRKRGAPSDHDRRTPQLIKEVTRPDQRRWTNSAATSTGRNPIRSLIETMNSLVSRVLCDDQREVLPRRLNSAGG